MKITFSQLSNPGPRAVNEDSLDCWVANSGETIAAIADGLGGMGGGDNASKLAISEFRKHLEKFGVTEDTMKKKVRWKLIKQSARLRTKGIAKSAWQLLSQRWHCRMGKSLVFTAVTLEQLSHEAKELNGSAKITQKVRGCLMRES